MTVALELDGVSACRGRKRVLEEVTLSIAEGDTVAILGPSGSGKSTLCRVLLGLTVPERGVVRIRGKVASDANRLVIPPELRNLAVVFQDLALWPHLSVAGNLRFVLRSRGCARNEEAQRIHDALGQVGLLEFGERSPGQLSGGEQQRLAIARALVLESTAILLDEPLANLDIVRKQELLELLRELFTRRGRTVIHVTHDPEEAVVLASRIVLLEQGRVVFDGSKERISESGSAFGTAVSRALARGS